MRACEWGLGCPERKGPIHQGSWGAPPQPGIKEQIEAPLEGPMGQLGASPFEVDHREGDRGGAPTVAGQVVTSSVVLLIAGQPGPGVPSLEGSWPGSSRNGGARKEINR